MKILTFLLKKTVSLSVLSIIVIFLLFIINFLSNNNLVAAFSKVEENMAISQGYCDIDFNIDENNTLELKSFIFDIGFANCVETKLKNKKITKVILNDVYGGDVTEARVFAKYIKKNNIPVLVKGVCNSACVDVFLHSPSRFICYNSKLGIHSYRAKDNENNLLIKIYGEIKQDAMLKAYEDTNINIDYIKKLYKETPHSSIYNPTTEEMKSNNFIHKEIPCSY